jgi:uncharacterized protein
MKILRRILRIVVVLFILLNVVAAFHAYKFTHFYTDAAAAKKKPEEMSAWEKTRAILFGITYQKSKNNDEPEIPYSTVRLYTTDSLMIEAWDSQHPLKSKGTVVLFHGHGSSKSKVLDEASYMFSIGYNVFLVDFRAHGGSDGKTCTIGYDEAEEVKLAYEHVRARGEKNVFLWGISMGAAAITRSISEYKLEPQKVILEMPFGTLKQAVKGRVRTMGLPEEPVSTLLTFWGGAEQGFWAFGHDPEDYAKDIHCPVLLQWGAQDPRVTRKETEAVFANLGTDKKQLVVYQSAKHESLYDKEPAKWGRSVETFLR